MNVELQSGDVFLTKGNSFVSKAIRFLTRDKGESRTEVNHVGVVVVDGNVQNAVIVEASSKVVRRTMNSYYKSKNTKVAVYRYRNLTDTEEDIIADYSESMVGAKYGYLKIVAHFLDWCLGGVYFFRRFAQMERYPICSWIVAYAYQDAGLGFGVRANAASPDDIWDWVVKPENGWVEIHPLELLSKEEVKHE